MIPSHVANRDRYHSTPMSHDREKKCGSFTLGSSMPGTSSRRLNRVVVPAFIAPITMKSGCFAAISSSQDHDPVVGTLRRRLNTHVA